MTDGDTSPRLLAIASAGGHWEQLMQLRPAMADADCLFVTTLDGLPQRSGLAKWKIVPDCNADQKLSALRCTYEIAGIIARFRPHKIVTTGALPGFIAIGLGRLFGAKTLWIDSVANAEQLSTAGRQARRLAHIHLSQWPDVASQYNTRYEGRIL